MVSYGDDDARDDCGWMDLNSTYVWEGGEFERVIWG